MVASRVTYTPTSLALMLTFSSNLSISRIEVIVTYLPPSLSTAWIRGRLNKLGPGNDSRFGLSILIGLKDEGRQKRLEIDLGLLRESVVRGIKRS